MSAPVPFSGSEASPSGVSLVPGVASSTAAPMEIATPRGVATDESRVEPMTDHHPAASGEQASSAAAASASSAASPAPATAAASPSDLPVVAPSVLKALDGLLFGPLTNCNEADRTRWQQQGFLFSDQPKTLFGLTQTAGGPCGVLAPVQGWILQRLLFGGVCNVSVNSDIPVSPTVDQRDESLVWALTHVLERARVGTQRTTFTLISGSSYDQLHQYELASADAVRAFYQQHLGQLHGPLGVLTFVFSLLLTRGLDTIRSDMDDPSQYLVGQFGHSSQELVNLLLTGRAVTNVFDGTKVLGDANDPTAFRLKGISERNSIGFLTLLEALRYSTVGEYLKSPLHPIWVVGSSNHYTVMFALDRRVGQLSTSQKKHRAVRTAFDELDPESNGFIQAGALTQLLAKLPSELIPSNGVTLDDIKRRLDPDGLGLILYERVITVLDQLDNQKRMALAQAATPNTPFSCSACTYDNVASASTCEVCGTPRPPPAAATAPKEDVEVVNFTLYHFNGIEITNKSLCECHRVDVSVVEGGLPPTIQGDRISEGQGLKEVILTRWPSCIIDIVGLAKIS